MDGLNARRTGQRDNDRMQIFEPGERDLVGRDAVTRRDRQQRCICGDARQRFAAAEWTIRKQPNAVARAMFRHAAEHAVFVINAQLNLDSVDAREAARLFNLGDSDVAQANRLDYTTSLQCREGADARRQWRPRVDGVQLIQIDRGDVERSAAAFAGGGQVPGAAVGFPAPVRTRQSALGCNRDARAIAVPRSQCLRDQPFVMADVAGVCAIDVGRVEQRHSGIKCRMQHANRALLVSIRIGRETHASDGDGPVVHAPAILTGFGLNSQRANPRLPHLQRARHRCTRRQQP